MIVGVTYAAGSAPQLQPVAPPTIERIRRLADGGGERYGIDFLLEYGRSAFPAYVVILNDPNSKTVEIAGVLCAIGNLDVPRGEFLPYAVDFLTHKDALVRQSAIFLVGEIGTRAEASILIALISDKDRSVALDAVLALVKVGGPAEVIALDAWLCTGSAHRENKKFLDFVKMYRDRLDKRLRKVPDKIENKN
jgi:HEAT repeat protein